MTKNQWKLKNSNISVTVTNCVKNDIKETKKKKLTSLINIKIFYRKPPRMLRDTFRILNQYNTRKKKIFFL